MSEPKRRGPKPKPAGTTKARLCVSLDPDIAILTRVACLNLRIDISALVSILLEEGLDRLHRKHGDGIFQPPKE